MRHGDAHRASPDGGVAHDEARQEILVLASGRPVLSKGRRMTL